MSLSLLIAALSVQPNAADLNAGQRCYEMTRGGESFGYTRQTIKSAPSVKGDAWAIRVEQLIPANSFRFTDTFLVTKEALRPVAFHSVLRGEEIARLLYLDDKIVGWKKGEEAIEGVDIPVEGAVYEGNLWGVMLSSLDFSQETSMRLPVYQYHRGLTEFVIDVVGEETIETPSGSRDVWQVQLGHTPEQRATYLIGKDDGVEYGYRGAGFAQAMLPDCSSVEALDGQF